jgi:hypothetical protein
VARRPRVADAWKLARLAAQGADLAGLDRLASSVPAGARRGPGMAAAVFPVYSLLHEIGQVGADLGNRRGSRDYFLRRAGAGRPWTCTRDRQHVVILRNKLKAGST